MSASKPMLTRTELAEALSREGYPVTRGALAVMASRGGGPAFRRWGSTPLYPLDSALEWASRRMSEPVTRVADLRKS